MNPKKHIHSNTTIKQNKYSPPKPIPHYPFVTTTHKHNQSHTQPNINSSAQPNLQLLPYYISPANPYNHNPNNKIWTHT